MTTISPNRPGIEILAEDERRVEGEAKVKGEARYAADFALPGMLWAAFLRSPIPHARILSVDTSRAREMPGVRAVLTGADIGEHYFGRALFDWPVIAIDRVRFIGDTVAAVAADTRELAEAAVAAIDVSYEELPAVFEPEESLADGAPVLHEHPERYPYLGKQRPATPHPNVHGHMNVVKGDPDGAFARADRIFEHRFTTPRFFGGFVEPRATLVWIDDGGIVHVVSTNKSPFLLRDQLAIATDVPKEQIVVEQAHIGGDFGAKGLSLDEFPCYFLARATRRPVKFVRTYLDDLQGSNTRHASTITIKTGVTSDGCFVAMDMRVRYNGGAYAAGKPVPTLLPGGVTKTPYRIPHARQERMSVYTNTIPAGHVRAPGDIQVHFALESHVDMIARELGIDPLEFRKRNAIGPNETDIDGTRYLEPHAHEIIEELRRMTAWDEPLPPGRGRGAALAVRHIGGGETSVTLALQASGDIVIRTGLADQGSGHLTMIQRVAAAETGLDPTRIRVEHGSTASAPFDPGAGGSRATHIAGRAVLDALYRLRSRLYDAGWDGAPATWDAAARAATRSSPLEIVGSFEAAHGDEPQANNFSGYVADVSVDPQTGAVTVNEIVLVADVGTIINPVAHRGQLNGGVVFGLGSGLTEELVLDGGKILNLSLGEYKLPTAADVPPLRTKLLHNPTGPGPFGAKMAGEMSTSGIPPAIANAVAAACGARVTTLPITSERVFGAL